jgi:hypothetical protein
MGSWPTSPISPLPLLTTPKQHTTTHPTRTNSASLGQAANSSRISSNKSILTISHLSRTSHMIPSSHGCETRGTCMKTHSRTTIPDLMPFHSHGGKILTFHGESDPSIPAASSAHYHESVRGIMYSNMAFNAATEAMADWYRHFLTPGAAHCSINTLTPAQRPIPVNKPRSTDWVGREGHCTGDAKATHLAGEDKGNAAAWSLRRVWGGRVNGTQVEMDCVYDQEGVGAWMFDFDAWKRPLY